jgi:hypothetical protein
MDIPHWSLGQGKGSCWLDGQILHTCIILYRALQLACKSSV